MCKVVQYFILKDLIASIFDALVATIYADVCYYTCYADCTHTPRQCEMGTPFLSCVVIL